MAGKFGDRWHVRERADTWNLMDERRCVARFQKKVGSEHEARRAAALFEALEGIEDPAAFMEAVRVLGKSTGVTLSGSIGALGAWSLIRRMLSEVGE